jgi:TPR repeat protein
VGHASVYRRFGGDLGTFRILLLGGGRCGSDRNRRALYGRRAYLYQRGDGVPQDGTMARRLYKQGCDGGYAQACKMLSSE